MVWDKRTEEIIFFKYFKVIKSGKLVIILCTLLLVFLSLVYSKTTRPVFQATTKVLIERASYEEFTIKGIMGVDPEQQDFHKTQFQILKSRSLAKSVIQKLHLENSDELNKEAPMIDLSFFKEWIKLWIADPNIKKRSLEFNLRADPYSKWIDAFLKRLQVSPILETRIVTITFEGYSPGFVALVANTMAETYILETISLRNSAGSGAKDWLVARIDESNIQVKKAELALKDFIRNNSISATKTKDDPGRLTTIHNQLLETETEILRLKNLKKQFIHLKVDPIKLIKSIPDSVKTESVTQLTEGHLRLQQEYQDKLNIFGINHPDIAHAREKIKNIERRILKEIDRFFNSIDIDTKAIQEKKRFLIRMLAEQEENFTENTIKSDLDEIQYETLKRNLEGNNKLHEMLASRLKEALLTLKNDATNIRIIDRAEIQDHPVRPRVIVNAIVAFIVGLFGGGFIVIVKDKFDEKIFSEEDIENRIPFPVLGAITTFNRRDDQSYDINKSNFQRLEEFGILSASYLKFFKNKTKHICLVTSTGPNEGKTTVVENLAVALAGMGKKVLVVDTDLKNSKQEFILMVNERVGWTDLIFENKSTVQECIYQTNVERVWALPKGSKIPKHPGMIFNSKAFKFLLTAMKNSFDIVILDSAPALGLSDSIFISEYCDATIFVIKSGGYNFKKIGNALKHLCGTYQWEDNKNGTSNDGKQIGVIINMLKDKNIDNYKIIRKSYGKFYDLEGDNGFEFAQGIERKLKMYKNVNYNYENEER